MPWRPIRYHARRHILESVARHRVPEAIACSCCWRTIGWCWCLKNWLRIILLPSKWESWRLTVCLATLVCHVITCDRAKYSIGHQTACFTVTVENLIRPRTSVRRFFDNMRWVIDCTWQSASCFQKGRSCWSVAARHKPINRRSKVLQETYFSSSCIHLRQLLSNA